MRTGVALKIVYSSRRMALATPLEQTVIQGKQIGCVLTVPALLQPRPTGGQTQQGQGRAQRLSQPYTPRPKILCKPGRMRSGAHGVVAATM